MKFLWIVSALLLSACVGGTLSKKGSFEEYELVPATPKEDKALRKCLEAIYQDQSAWFAKRHSYQRRTDDLQDSGPVNAACQDILVGLRSSKAGYTGIARINHDESTVRWTINEKHEIYEHTDTDLRDDLDW